MAKCKTKAIQTNLGTFRHTYTYPGIIHAHSGIFRALCYTDIFKTGISRTLTYSETETYTESRHIHNPGIFKTPPCSKLWHIQNLRHIQNPVTHLNEALIVFPAYNYFHKRNKYLEVVSPEIVMLCKKLWYARRPWTVNFW